MNYVLMFGADGDDVQRFATMSHADRVAQFEKGRRLVRGEPGSARPAAGGPRVPQGRSPSGVRDQS